MKEFSKNFFKLLIFTFAFFLLTSTMVNAKPIIKRDDDNPDGDTPLSLVNGGYSIEVDDESGIGYVYYTENNETEVLGTCNIIIVDINGNAEVVGKTLASEVQYGTIVITLTEDGKGVVSNVDGALASIYAVNENVIVLE